MRSERPQSISITTGLSPQIYYRINTLSQTTFTSVKLQPALIENLNSMGYTNMTQIQAESLPHVLAGKDVIAQGKTGSGKTAAFGLGILEKLNVKRSELPAITHVDYSARVQTVHKETNHLYHKVISAFKDQTGCPVLVNTSFNVRDEPIVCTPKDAFKCFMGTDIEVLVCGNAILYKDKQDPKLALDYKNNFSLD